MSQFRLESGLPAPHRGSTILVLGILSLVIGCLGWVFGVVAWTMANSDLRSMDAGRMDAAGRGLTQAQVAGAQQLVLSHRQSADQLTQGFGKGQVCNPPVQPTPTVIGVQPFGHRFQRSNAGGNPGQAMMGTLMGEIDMFSRGPRQIAIAPGRP